MCLNMSGIITARKRSLGQGNIFIGVCQEFCSQGGVPGQVPLWDQVHPPLGPGTPTPQDQVHPPEQTPLEQTPTDQVHPPDQVHLPPGPGTPPRTRYTPWDQVHPWDWVHSPQDQIHPPAVGVSCGYTNYYQG